VCRRAATVLGVAGVSGLALLVVARGPDNAIGVGAAERLVVFPLQVWAVVVGVALLVGTTAATRARRSLVA
jgi:hypothetical protein